MSLIICLTFHTPVGRKCLKVLFSVFLLWYTSETDPEIRSLTMIALNELNLAHHDITKSNYD